MLSELNSFNADYHIIDDFLLTIFPEFAKDHSLNVLTLENY